MVNGQLKQIVFRLQPEQSRPKEGSADEIERLVGLFFYQSGDFCVFTFQRDFSEIDPINAKWFRRMKDLNGRRSVSGKRRTQCLVTSHNFCERQIEGIYIQRPSETLNN